MIAFLKACAKAARIHYLAASSPYLLIMQHLHDIYSYPKEGQTNKSEKMIQVAVAVVTCWGAVWGAKFGTAVMLGCWQPLGLG